MESDRHNMERQSGRRKRGYHPVWWIIVLWTLLNGVSSVEFSVVSYNVALLRLNDPPTHDARRTQILSDLATLDADFLCLQEVWEDSDAIILEQFLAAHDYQTFRVVLSNPTPPCSGQVIGLAGLVQSAEFATCVGDDLSINTYIRCIAETDPAKYSRLISSGCQACAQKALALQSGSPDVATALLDCSNAQTELFGVNHGLMLLSKLPMTNARSMTIPHEGLFRGALLASVQGVEIACTHLTPGSELGERGNMTSSEGSDGVFTFSGAVAERNSQIRAIDAAFSSNSDTPMVFLGDMNCGESNSATNDNSSPESYREFGVLGWENIYPEQVGSCTFCGRNDSDDLNPRLAGAGWGGRGSNSIIDHIFTKNVNTSQLNYSRILDGSDAQSDHYGVKVTFEVQGGSSSAPALLPIAALFSTAIGLLF